MTQAFGLKAVAILCAISSAGHAACPGLDGAPLANRVVFSDGSGGDVVGRVDDVVSVQWFGPSGEETGRGTFDGMFPVELTRNGTALLVWDEGLPPFAAYVPGAEFVRTGVRTNPDGRSFPVTFSVAVIAEREQVVADCVYRVLEIVSTTTPPGSRSTILYEPLQRLPLRTTIIVPPSKSGGAPRVIEYEAIQLE